MSGVQTNNSQSGKPGGLSLGFKLHTCQSSTEIKKQSNANKHQKSKGKRNNRRTKIQQNNIQTNEMEIKKQEFIELGSESISTLIDNDHLNCDNATSLHDLQCGTGIFVVQAFLEKKSLKRVLGIESNKEFFYFACKNLLNLVKNTYNNRRFLLVEHIPGVKLTIAEKLAKDLEDKKKFKKGDVVVCLNPLKRSINKRENYNGIIDKVYDDGIHYDVRMYITKKILKNVHRESIFKSGNERTLEIAKGNLFERSDSFRSDILLLPYVISNDSFKSLLLTGCKRSMFGARILSYFQLESWDDYPMESLRRIDINVYDFDRFNCNLGNNKKIYIYEHVLSHKLPSQPKECESNIKVGMQVSIIDNISQHWFVSDVKKVLKDRIVIERVKWEIKESEEIKFNEQRIRLIKNRFKIGDNIIAYSPKNINNGDIDGEMYTLYDSQVLNVNIDGTYVIQYSDGEVHHKVLDIWMFKKYYAKYKENDILLALRYDLNDSNDDDDDDEVKENVLSPEYTVPNDMINIINVDKPDFGIKQLEISLLDYIASNDGQDNGYENEFTKELIKEEKIRDLDQHMPKDNKKKPQGIWGNEMPEVLEPDLDSQYIELLTSLKKNKKNIPELGKELTKSNIELLTEEEAEYQVEVVKRVYKKYIVLQFQISTSLPKQIIKDVYVKISYDDTELTNFTCPYITKDKSGNALTIIERENDDSDDDDDDDDDEDLYDTPNIVTGGYQPMSVTTPIAPDMGSTPQ
mmetsp:Transcript_49279/g.60530  ORF Transcript_49279/g.60530 Transcript_49279/m.60530 type:complete len:745 (-) Transcript_49279:36-2270(-)